MLEQVGLPFFPPLAVAMRPDRVERLKVHRRPLRRHSVFDRVFYYSGPIDLLTGCQQWLASCDGNGRPAVRDERRRTVRVARLVLRRKLGRPIRAGYMALHICNQKWCIAEAHLYEGTAAENAADRERAGNYGRLLTDEEQWIVRSYPADAGFVASFYAGVHVETVRRIRRKR